MKFQIPGNSGRRGNIRRQRGQGLAELCAALVFGVPLILAGIDLGFIALGATINDSVCRDAARAAASGPPAEKIVGAEHKVSQGQAPYQRAQAVIKNHVPTNLPVKVNELPELVEVVRDVPPKDMGGAIDGDIAVKTTVSIMPPFVLRLIGGTNGVSLTSRHKVPYTYVMEPPPKQP